ncbi:MAG TPA: hypothetical protein VKQ36_06375, partial [Ktedonobacterales bacterium]|nr:hypothetical protein [Ktedonobacterales bacterium]
ASQAVEHVYLSQGLAGTFDASFFVQEGGPSGASATPGTLSVTCEEITATYGIKDCSLSTGETLFG